MSTALQKHQPTQLRQMPARTEAAAPTITLSFALNALRQWWMVAIPAAFLLSAGSAGAVWYLFDPLYVAESWIRIDDHTPYIAYQQRDNSKRFVETQVGLIKSPLVVAEIVGKPEIARMPEVAKQLMPAEWVQAQTSVESVGDSELYRIRFAGPNPTNAAAIVNAITDNYFELQTQEDASRTQRVIEVLEQQKERRSQAVMQLRETVRELSKQTTGKDPFGPNPVTEVVALQHPLVALQDRLTAAEVEREILEAQLKVLEDPQLGLGDVPFPQTKIERSVEDHPEVARLKADLSSLRLMLLETEAHAKNPTESASYRRVQSEIETREKQLAALKEKVLKETSSEVSSDIETQKKMRHKEMVAKVATSRLSEQLLRDRYQRELANVKQSSGQSLELVFALAELSREEKVFELIAARTLELRTEMRAPSRVSLLRRAVAPSVPVESAPWKKLFLAVISSFSIPFVCVVLWERSVRRVSDSKQLAAESRLGNVWEIASLPPRARNKKSVDRKHSGLFEESVDSLRTGLILSEPLKDMQILAVTSAISREGKTSLASELAVSIARSSGEPTLLIDADMRSPDIHKIFDIPLGPGLADVLDGRISITEAIVTDWGQGIHILPAGKLQSSPHKLLGSGALKNILHELRATYRYIIIDTPPILPASEALVIAGSADATLICAKRDVSRVDQVETAFERLALTGAPPAAVVLNDVPARSYLYSYGRYAYPNSAA